MYKRVPNTFIRYLHDRKLPYVIPRMIPKQTTKIGIESPRKTDNDNVFKHYSRLESKQKEKHYEPKQPTKKPSIWRHYCVS